MRLRSRAAILGAAALAFATAAGADVSSLRVTVFPGATNAPILLAMSRGYFARQGLSVTLHNTPNSGELREGLAAGKFDIAHAAVDNAVAMVEVARHDAIVVLGGDHSMNEFMVRPEIGGFADLRGKVLAVDAPNTAYALAAKKILKSQGLLEGRDYRVRPAGGTMQRSAAMAADPELAAGLSNPPFSITYRGKLKSLGRMVDLIGPYQATGAFVMRAWAGAHGELLERYLAAYVQGMRATLDPANRDEVIAVLVERFKIEPAAARETYEAMVTPGFGLAPDARFDLEGFRTVLAVRAEMEGQWGGTPPSPEKFLDLGYYRRALARLGG